MSVQLFDTHAHLDEEQLFAAAEQVVARAVEAGVKRMVAVGTTASSSQVCLEMAARFEPLLASVGIQPNYCAEAESEDWGRIEKLAREPHCVALGETGLDRYWDHTPWDVQEDYFRRHLTLAATLNLPVIIHMRDCGADIVRVLRDQAQPLRAVMHSFTGDLALARQCLDLGTYISFAGMVTFKKSDALREVAAFVPADRILIETDAPYLSPHPHRGKRPNEPAMLIHTATCLAAARQSTLEDFAAQTTGNAQRFFGQPGLI